MHIEYFVGFPHLATVVGVVVVHIVRFVDHLVDAVVFGAVGGVVVFDGTVVVVDVAVY